MSKRLAVLAGAAVMGLSLALAFYLFKNGPVSNCVSLPCSGTGCAAMVRCTPDPANYLWFFLPAVVAVACAAFITYLSKKKTKA